jgi:hypothetical protein
MVGSGYVEHGINAYHIMVGSGYVEHGIFDFWQRHSIDRRLDLGRSGYVFRNQGE